jgi:hypothetical protein
MHMKKTTTAMVSKVTACAKYAKKATLEAITMQG